MRTSKKGPNTFGLKLISIILLLFSLLGLLGGLGFVIGKKIFSVVATILGNHFAWVGLFFCLIIALVLWVFSANLITLRFRTTSKIVQSKAVTKTHSKRQIERETSKQRATNFKPNEEGIPLPAGKLINLQGFNQYFSSPEWVEIKEIDQQQATEMNELGKDFPSYFGSGETFFLKDLIR